MAASAASQPTLVPILPPAPHEPVRKALVLRLSEQSLDALRELVRSGLLDKPGNPTVELELGEGGSSALHVPTASGPFPLSATVFAPPLELLSQRAHVASAPFHLAARAHTRYAVRHTDVSQSAKERLREGKEKEEREKRGRKIVQLEGHPAKLAKGKGRATASAGSRAGTPAGRSTSAASRGNDSLHPPASSSSSSAGRQASRSPAPPPLSRDGSRPGSNPLRTRILQLLALGPLSSKEVVGRVRANEGEVSRILAEIARPTAANPNVHRLLPQSFLQLEIFTWKQYSQADKTAVIAACEHAFDELRLPHDAEERRMVDPEWQGGSPLKQSVRAPSAAGSSSAKQRDGSTDSRASAAAADKKKVRREASPRPPPTKAAASSSESEEEVALSAKKRKGKQAEGDSAAKGKRRRTVAPDDLPPAAVASTTTATAAKPKIHRPPASPLLGVTSAPTPPAIVLAHVKAGAPDIASSPAGTPLPANGPSPPAPKKASKPAKGKPKRTATPDFTSSEEDAAGETDSSGDDGRTNGGGSTSTRSPSPPLPPLDLPSSRPALRKRFKDLFRQYEALNVLLESERQASEDLLAGRRAEGDGRRDRPWEDVRKDARRRNEWHRELEEIKRRLK